jgi:hypothetical protein
MVEDLRTEWVGAEDLIRCHALIIASALELALAHPEKKARMLKACREAVDALELQLNRFEIGLFRSLGIPMRRFILTSQVEFVPLGKNRWRIRKQSAKGRRRRRVRKGR